MANSPDLSIPHIVSVYVIPENPVSHNQFCSEVTSEGVYLRLILSEKPYTRNEQVVT